jgi:hypothetical protein
VFGGGGPSANEQGVTGGGGGGGGVGGASRRDASDASSASPPAGAAGAPGIQARQPGGSVPQAKRRHIVVRRFAKVRAKK